MSNHHYYPTRTTSYRPKNKTIGWLLVIVFCAVSAFFGGKAVTDIGHQERVRAYQQQVESLELENTFLRHPLDRQALYIGEGVSL